MATSCGHGTCSLEPVCWPVCYQETASVAQHDDDDDDDDDGEDDDDDDDDDGDDDDVG